MLSVIYTRNCHFSTSELSWWDQRNKTPHKKDESRWGRHTGSLNESPELNPVGMTQTNVAEMNERMQKIARNDRRFAEVVYFDESSSYRRCVIPKGI